MPPSASRPGTCPGTCLGTRPGTRLGTRLGARLGAPALAAALLVGCAGGDIGPAGSAAVVTDSAGVRIVSFPADPDPPTEVSAPAVIALERDGQEDYLFAGITGLAARADGGVVVAERDGTLRFFDASGTLVRRAGGEGDGPGEFAFLSRLFRLPGDTLAATDGRRGRTMFFAPDGTYLRETVFAGRTPAMPEGASQCFGPNVQGVLDDGRLALWGFQCVVGEGSPGPRDYLSDVLVEADDGFRTVTTEPILSATENPGAEPMRRFALPPVYGRPALAAHGTEVLVAIPSLGLRLRGFGADGTLVLDLRDATPEPPVTPEVRAAVEAGWNEELAEIHADAVWPETLEGWDAIRVMADGTVWLRNLQIWGSETGELWTSVSLDGTAHHRWRFPSGFELHDVRDGRAWGILRDEFDVEDVVALPLDGG